MKKKTKTLVIIAVLIAIAVLAGFGFCWNTVSQYRSEMETMTLAHTDASIFPMARISAIVMSP